MAAFENCMAFVKKMGLLGVQVVTGSSSKI
jgi:hypothetical protein